ncbi:MAG TPA: S8 family serine peptidase, partial [Myxococcales bacterium]|nr:S8 family serine peptidase [Myxococcales bacterium]
GNPLHRPEVRFTPQITAADGVDTTFFGFDVEGNGFPNFFGTSAAAPDAAATAALVVQAAGGPGSIRPDKLYKALQKTATPIPLPNDRTWSAAFSGPVAFAANGDWVRWNRYFGLAVQPFTSHGVASVAFDVTNAAMPMTFSLNPNRFHVGPASGVSRADITFTVSANQKVLTLNFAPGSFTAGDAFRFGMSVFNPLQGTTQIDPDRFRGATLTTTLDDGRTFTGTVFAAPRERVNNFTGFGLVNADAATRSVSGDRGQD